MSEIEKRFFETFGIEPVCLVKEMRKPVCYDTTKCKRCNWYEYPLITDHVLLELICILGSIFISVQDKETLKDHILNQCIMNQEKVKQQVKALIK